MSERDIAREIMEHVVANDPEGWAHLFARDPRYRYWETPDGRQFHYTTERMGDGKFASAIYVPKGKGARSGKKAVTRLSPSREVHHATRRAARARAYKLYQQHVKDLEGRS